MKKIMVAMIHAYLLFFFSFVLAWIVIGLAYWICPLDTGTFLANLRNQTALFVSQYGFSIIVVPFFLWPSVTFLLSLGFFLFVKGYRKTWITLLGLLCSFPGFLLGVALAYGLWAFNTLFHVS